MSLTAWSIEIPHSVERETAVRHLRSSSEPLLVLDTCQRLEVYGRSGQHIPAAEACWTEVEAFERLARIAAGLESRILGELEVLGQVRNAYKTFRQTGPVADSYLDRFFQDVLSLARKARRHSGIDKQMTSLSGLAGREILARVPKGEPIAVIGSGNMATSVIRYLGKRDTSPVRVSSRCPENAMTLATSVGGFGSSLEDLAPMLNGVAGIVCATAAPHPIVYPSHLNETKRPLHVVDLGVPADCDKDVQQLEFVSYIGLEDVEATAQENLADRSRRAQVAEEIIRDGAIAWAAKR